MSKFEDYSENDIIFGSILLAAKEGRLIKIDTTNDNEKVCVICVTDIDENGNSLLYPLARILNKEEAINIKPPDDLVDVTEERKSKFNSKTLN